MGYNFNMCGFNFHAKFHTSRSVKYTAKHFKYNEKNAAFIDIFGFKELVNISPQNPSQFDALCKCMRLKR